MKSKKAEKNKKKMPSTHTYLPIAEVKDGVAIMKDGTLRAVLMTSSINFALKSEDEQNSLVSSYVGFLNSLDFPLQIVVQSRHLQIQPYLDKLIKIEKEQPNELLRSQTADYRSFVKELVEMRNIMTKNFYVVVPYDPVSNTKRSFWSRFKEVLRPAITVRLKEERFHKRREDLDLRVRQVFAGLQGMGLDVVQLDTQALIELFYSTYNPDISFTEKLPNLNEIRLDDF